MCCFSFSLSYNVALVTPNRRREIPVDQTLVSARVKEPDDVRRRRALKRVDRELSKGNFKAALSLVKQLKGKPGGLRGFGAVKQVPRGISSLDELKLGEVDKPSLQSEVDSILDSIRRSIQLVLSEQVSVLELERMMHDERYDDSSSDDNLRCIQHEAGHFLVGYFLGVLPKGYRVPGMEDLGQGKFFGGKMQFLGFEFLEEVNVATVSKNSAKGKLHNGTLNRFLCVTLGGLVAEHLIFGNSEGLYSDVVKLEQVLKWQGKTQTEADHRIKWATINTVLILSRHQEAGSRLAEAMSLGKSIGFCIDRIESTLGDKEI